ncbi:MAG: nucleotidyltransferase [Bacilli bacterium]|nr:nucleotidyltransferase [Bacilli bacterium]
MNKTLLILAAGMGSRYGGLKQIEPVGPFGEFIIDYSIYDAIKAGFNKVVFIIKEENYDLFRETVGKRIESKVKVEYVFQNLDNLPKGYTIPEERVKPLGTAQAVLCAKNVISEPFVMINSDDSYGYDAYKSISEFIDNGNQFGLVGYNVINTLTENGSVKRGVCFTKNNKLENLIESKVEKKNGIIVCEPINGGEPFTISDDTKVSMNMIAFTPRIFDYIEKNFPKFLDSNKDNILKCEYLIPDVLALGIKENFCDVTVVSTTSKWVGVTYKEDKDSVVNYINVLIQNGEYPSNLWN